MSGIKVVPSVFVVIEKGGKYLLLRRANTGYMDGWYDLPAGHLEDQEKFQDGAARELKEEAGLDVKPRILNWSMFTKTTPASRRTTAIFLPLKPGAASPKLWSPANVTIWVSLAWMNYRPKPCRTPNKL
jgi:8-oxo-dGTP pyrophosphatase MutT (NUDIX family)